MARQVRPYAKFYSTSPTATAAVPRHPSDSPMPMTAPDLPCPDQALKGRIVLPRNRDRSCSRSIASSIFQPRAGDAQPPGGTDSRSLGAGLHPGYSRSRSCNARSCAPFDIAAALARGANFRGRDGFKVPRSAS